MHVCMFMHGGGAANHLLRYSTKSWGKEATVIELTATAATSLRSASRQRQAFVTQTGEQP